MTPSRLAGQCPGLHGKFISSPQTIGGSFLTGTHENQPHVSFALDEPITLKI